MKKLIFLTLVFLIGCNSETPSPITNQETVVEIVQNNYSLEEVPLMNPDGTPLLWIDGKPIYRKVYKGNLDGNGDAIIELNGVSEVIHSNSYITVGQGHYKLPFVDNLGKVTDWEDTNNNRCKLNTTIINGGYTYIVEYTKNTD